MTIREYIRRRVVVGYGLIFLGMALFIASVVFFPGDVGEVLPIPLIAFIPFFAAIVYIHFGLRCPRCRGNLAMTPAAYPTFSKKYRFNYCPYCGVSVDEQLSGSEGAA